MSIPTPPSSDLPLAPLALAVITSSSTPLVLLDGDFRVIAASDSHCRAFGLDPAAVSGSLIFQLGGGEWDLPKLRSLLAATASGAAAIDAYELELETPDREPRYLLLNARKLDYIGETRIMLAISDVTDVRAADRAKDDLLRDKSILLQELQHRVANSLQIIASVLMQSARRVQSDEARYHLHAAHSRVISVAEVQRQLTASQLGDVALRTYLVQLAQCIAASMISDPDRVMLKVIVDDSVVPADTSVSIGLIVTELVINALKHAFPGRGHGHVEITYGATGGGWTLAVADDGVGMPTAPSAIGTGLGTTIVEALAKRLDATIHTVAAEPGTRVSLVHEQRRRLPCTHTIRVGAPV